MKTTVQKLRQRIKAMPRHEVDALVMSIVRELYQDRTDGTLDSEAQWDQGTIERVAALLASYELNPRMNP